MKTTRTLPLALLVSSLAAVIPAGALHAAPPEPAPAKARDTRPAFIGVEIMPVDAPTRALFKLPAVGGLLVTGVGPDSPADGKLGQGDILLKLEDQTLVNREQLRALVRSRAVGDTLALTVVRGGRTETVKITLAAAPAPERADDFAPPSGADLFREMREHTRRALRDAGHPESLLDATDDVIVLSPPGARAGVSTAAARTSLKPEGSVTVIKRDGKTFVTVKDKDGKTLADGELTDALRGEIPAWAKPALDEPAAKP